MRYKRNEAQKLNAVLIISALVVLSVTLSYILTSSFTPKPPELKENTNSIVPEIPLLKKLIKEGGEIRAMWIATVANINFPSSPGLDEAALKGEIDDILTTLIENSMNTVIFQVRPSSDAFYTSDIFPSSEYLCGIQGVTPPFDVLEYLVEEAHKLDIAVCAWVNPLRVSTQMNSSKGEAECLHSTNPAYINPQYCVSYGSGLYYDPGIPEVRSLVASGVKEIAENYSVDAIVFDDYFYPYPEDGIEYDDSASYAKYGGTKERGDWRRQNINMLIEESYNAVKSASKSCLFGISPFGIWQNDNGSNGGSQTKGLSAYSAIYCDAKAWIAGGYIDFISPQLYWNFASEAAPFAELCDWWDNTLKGTDIPLIVSHGAYRTEEWNDPNEIGAQIEYARTKPSYIGSAMYGYSAIKANACGVSDCLKEVY